MKAMLWTLAIAILAMAYAAAFAVAGMWAAQNDQPYFRICGPDGVCDTIAANDIQAMRATNIKLRDGRFLNASASVEIMRDFDAERAR